ncbi:MAG: DUF1643 domain-containing protein [Pseudomonadota bacterium]
MIERRHTDNGIESVAVYSGCERYRFRLSRIWAPADGMVAFVMLNPSTADERLNDPTVERCQRRTRALGYGAFTVVNVFAYRATRPGDLKSADDPVGRGNDAAICSAAASADMILCAWGVHGAHLGRGPAVAETMRASGRRLFHLGLSKHGHPRHPLYVSYAVTPRVWTAEPQGA